VRISSPMSEIRIVEYDPTWPDQFSSVARQIAGAIGSDALRIDHIGSTSVPGLAAKDIVDVQITVADLEEPGYSQGLEAAGFRLRDRLSYDLLVGLSENDFELEKRFFREPEGQRRAHIHVREKGRLNQLYPLLFRDYLRSDAVVRSAYETVKRELASHFQNDADAYYRIKDPYMDTIYQGARLWAAQTGWHLE
jgi:GrpB-like predicted nucleotidyltransferase (UPF0157 family)